MQIVWLASAAFQLIISILFGKNGDDKKTQTQRIGLNQSTVSVMLSLKRRRWKTEYHGESFTQKFHIEIMHT